MDATLYGLLIGKIKQAFSKEKIDDAINSYFEENPISSGATEEQVAQIEENTTNIANKLDKNQGVENSGKITGIDEQGNIIPMVPSGVTYNEETNCLEYGVDERLNLNAGIQLDDTLTKSGYAADAASVGELKGDLSDIQMLLKKIKELLSSTELTDSEIVEGINRLLVSYFETLTVSEVQR